MDSSSSSEDKPVNLVAAWTKGRKDAEKPLTGATAGAPLPNELAAAPLVSSSFRRQLENMQPERLKALFAAAPRIPPIGTITAQIEAEAAAARGIAEKLIPHGRKILDDAQRSGYNIFAPFGASLVHYMDEESSEDFELDPDLLPARNTDSIPERAVMTADPESAAPRESSATPAESSYDPDGDVEDALAIAEPEGKFSVHVEIDGKLIPKAKALSAMMRYRGVRSSTDRLRRVAGVLSFNPTMEGSGCDDALSQGSILY
ncbi:hypothetical protein B0H10DRAFT_2223076 [Mycena sp. CBHHK59/15]|nr:hypothetical protein B0H10DRAFT_2223076 [Mycena sp. CBHHK59/15]